MFFRRPSSLEREIQHDLVKKANLNSEIFANREDKLIRVIEGFKLNRRARRQLRETGIKLLREGSFPAKRNFFEKFIKPFLPPAGVLSMDGAFYHDTRSPFIAADPVIDVTMAATDKAMYTASHFPALGGQYWTMIGKKMRIRIFGKITTAATPGNITLDIYYGSGADANGTILASSAAKALQANQTGLLYMIEVEIVCVSTGSAGTLFCTGWSLWNVAVILSTAQPVLIPDSAAVVSAGVDLTAANIISIQSKRSGSTAEHIFTQQMSVVAMN